MWEDLEQNFISVWCKILQPEQSIAEERKLKQKENENNYIYIAKFEKFYCFFKNSLYMIENR